MMLNILYHSGYEADLCKWFKSRKGRLLGLTGNSYMLMQSWTQHRTQKLWQFPFWGFATYLFMKKLIFGTGSRLRSEEQEKQVQDKLEVYYICSL